MHSKRYLHIAGSIFVGIIFLYFAARNIQVDNVVSTAKRASPLWMFAVCVLIIVGFFIRTLRWRFMFRPEHRSKMRVYFKVFMLGSFGNIAFPGRIGDLVRALVLGKNVTVHGVRGCLASIVLEKTLDGLLLLCIFAIALAILPLDPWIIEYGYYALIIFGSLFLLLFWVSQTGNRRGTRVEDGGGKILDIFLSQIERFNVGLHALRSFRDFALLFFVTAIIWILELLTLYSALRMLDIDLPPGAPLICLVSLSIGTMLPAAPGFIGTYQFFLVSALSIYGVSKDVAFAMSVLLNALLIFTTIFIASITLGSALPLLGRSFMVGADDSSAVRLD